MNTGVGCHFLLQGIFPALGLNTGLPYCRQILYQLSHKGSPDNIFIVIMMQKLIINIIKIMIKFGEEDEEGKVELSLSLITFINLKITFFFSFYYTYLRR